MIANWDVGINETKKPNQLSEKRKIGILYSRCSLGNFYLGLGCAFVFIRHTQSFIYINIYINIVDGTHTEALIVLDE
jgi:hypothetical protein